MKKLLIALLCLLPSYLTHAGLLNTTYDASQVTVNVGTNNSDGHAVLYMKGRYNVTSTAKVKFCIVIDPLILSTMQGFGDLTLYRLLWFTPSCTDTDNVPPCIPSGAIGYLSADHPWCLQ
jgi:hypothetical protein